MMAGGHILAGKGPWEELVGIPQVVQMDRHGNEVWSWAGGDPWIQESTGEEKRSGYHHDLQRKGNPVYFTPKHKSNNTRGSTLILSHWLPPLSETCPNPEIPYDPETNTGCISKFQLMDDAILEVNWNGNIDWQWRAYSTLTRWDLMMRL